MICEVIGKKRMSGNRVSHSNRKTKREYKPNINKHSFVSKILGLTIKLKVCTSALRTITTKGGIDEFLMSMKSRELAPKAVSLRKQIIKKSL